MIKLLKLFICIILTIIAFLILVILSPCLLIVILVEKFIFKGSEENEN